MLKSNRRPELIYNHCMGLATHAISEASVSVCGARAVSSSLPIGGVILVYN